MLTAQSAFISVCLCLCVAAASCSRKEPPWVGKEIEPGWTYVDYERPKDVDQEQLELDLREMIFLDEVRQVRDEVVFISFGYGRERQLDQSTAGFP